MFEVNCHQLPPQVLYVTRDRKTMVPATIVHIDRCESYSNWMHSTLRSLSQPNFHPSRSSEPPQYGIRREDAASSGGGGGAGVLYTELERLRAPGGGSGAEALLIRGQKHVKGERGGGGRASTQCER